MEDRQLSEIHQQIVSLGMLLRDVLQKLDGELTSEDQENNKTKENIQKIVTQLESIRGSLHTEVDAIFGSHPDDFPQAAARKNEKRLQELYRSVKQSFN